MANVRFQYRSKKDRANIEVRFSYKENGKWISLGTRTNTELAKRFWNEYKKGTNFRDVDRANLKTEIDTHFKSLETFLLSKFADTDNIKPDWLKNAVNEYYNPKKEDVIPDDLLSYFDYFLNRKSNEIPPKSVHWQKWQQVKQKVELLEGYTGKRYLVKDVNEDFKKDFEDCLLYNDYSPTTIRKSFKFLKTLCFHAQSKGINISPELPQLSVKIKDRKEAPKVYLSFQELEQIKALTDLPEYLDNARDWLLISCHTGQRVSDFMRFNSSMIRKSKGKQFLDLTQQKTGKDVTVPLIPEALEILDKRNGEFPRRISDQRYNDYIKEVCEKAGITNEMYGKKPMVTKVKGNDVKRAVPGTYPKFELIGSHVGRRSFATNYYGKLPTSYLKNITGHSTEAMLLKYIGKTSNDTAFEAYDLMTKK